MALFIAYQDGVIDVLRPLLHEAQRNRRRLEAFDEIFAMFRAAFTGLHIHLEDIVAEGAKVIV